MGKSLTTGPVEAEEAKKAMLDMPRGKVSGNAGGNPCLTRVRPLSSDKHASPAFPGHEGKVPEAVEHFPFRNSSLIQHHVAGSFVLTLASRCNNRLEC